MTPDLLKAAAASNQWVAIMPEILLGCLALLLLVALLAIGFWPKPLSDPLNATLNALYYPAARTAQPAAMAGK